MSSTISGTQTSEVTLVSSLYADPVLISGKIDVATGDAVLAPTAWTIDITGAVYAALGDGLTLQAGGSIDNSGVVSAGSSGLVSTSGKPFQITNEVGGTIIGSGIDAIRLSGNVSSSTLMNAGFVEADSGGVGLLLGAASGTNESGGIIQGGKAGIQLGNVSQFANEGTVDGATGILVPYDQNYVTIVEAALVSASVGDAISFASGAASSITDFLTISPGALLDGVASGGQVADLVFAGSTSGSVANIGQEFVLFPTISIAPKADWEFSGVSSISAVFENDGQLVVRSGDTLTVTAGVTGTGSIDLGGGLIDFANTVAAGEIVDFSAAGSTMLFDKGHAFAGTVAGFAVGDTIEVTGFGMSRQVTGTLSGDVLTLTDGMTPVTITFASAPGTLVVEPIAGTDPMTYEVIVPCFRSGTRLLTPEGLRPVESLRAGDAVVTRSGAVRPIIWHGQRRIDCVRHPNPELVWPVLIDENAFGTGEPCHDLYLSPDHALWFDEGLVEVKYLVNDVSVRQVELREVTYHHIELESHDVVLAEMLPVETYLDCGNRHNFEAEDGFVALFPTFGPSTRNERHACGPLICDGPVLTAIRCRLHRLLHASGAREVPGQFGIFAGGERLVPTRVEHDRWEFMLPEGVCEVIVSSTASNPSVLDPASQDRRRLGIALAHVELDEIPLDIQTARFSAGFHEAECAESGWFRWTNGEGRIDVAGARRFAFILQAVAPVWHVPEEDFPQRLKRRVSVSRC